MSSDITTTGPNVAPSRVPERRRLTNVVVTFLSIGNSGEEMLLARELADIERCIERCRGRPDIIREMIEKGDVVLAAHRSAINDLSAALVPVKQKDIAVEIADLMLAFPGKDDLAEFIPLVEQPTRLELAAACHCLRCNKKFRPAISEVLEELTEVAFLRRIEPFAKLEANLDKARAYLAEMEAERAAELAKPRFVVQPPRIPGLGYRSHFQFLLIDRHDEQKKVVRRFYNADAVVGFMKTADPATTECSEETKAALIEAERDAERDRDAADVFPSAG
jgi:hypothetical protein